MCAAGLIERFEEARPGLRAVAYRMLGSVDDAEDAVQEAWLRLSRNRGNMDNVDAWLTTVVARICLNMLRARRARHDEELLERLPGPHHRSTRRLRPRTSSAAGRFGRFGAVRGARHIAAGRAAGVRTARRLRGAVRRNRVDRRPVTRGRPQASQPRPSAHSAGTTAARRRHRRPARIVDAFFAAGRAGDFERLVAVLDPDVVLRADFGGPTVQVTAGAMAVARLARLYGGKEREVRAAIVNGAAGAVIFEHNRPFSVMAFVVSDGRVVAIDTLADPARIARLDLSAITQPFRAPYFRTGPASSGT